MTHEEQVAFDALESIGITGVTIFQVRCLAAWRAVVEKLGRPNVTEFNSPRALALERIQSDICYASIDDAHVDAQWEDVTPGRRQFAARKCSNSLDDSPRRSISWLGRLRWRVSRDILSS